MTTAAELGPGGVRDDGKPIFIATDHKRFSPSVDHELTDQEQLAWKSFQLWRTTQGIERRDSVFRTIINSEYTNFNLNFHIMGTPYPVIEDCVSFKDCLLGIRWYEHAMSAAAAYGYNVWIKSKATTRAAQIMPMSRSCIVWGTFVMVELCFAYRSLFRLQGYAANDHECRKFGVLEDKQRLEKKKEMWEKYAAYKKEWCRRFDYHVFGIRPGENFSLWSACWIPALVPSYNTITDYPPRKNPYFLTSTPLVETFVEGPMNMNVLKQDNVPLIKARPELKYLYHGPIDAAESAHKQSNSSI